MHTVRIVFICLFVIYYLYTYLKQAALLFWSYLFPINLSRYANTAIISGADSKLGSEYARQLFEKNFNLILIGGNGEILENLVENLWEEHFLRQRDFYGQKKEDENEPNHVAEPQKIDPKIAPQNAQKPQTTTHQSNAWIKLIPFDYKNINYPDFLALKSKIDNVLLQHEAQVGILVNAVGEDEDEISDLKLLENSSFEFSKHWLREENMSNSPHKNSEELEFFLHENFSNTNLHFNISMISNILMTGIILPKMISNITHKNFTGSGIIVNISSVDQFIFNTFYTSSKNFLTNFSKNLNSEMIDLHPRILVQSLQPAFILLPILEKRWPKWMFRKFCQWTKFNDIKTYVKYSLRTIYFRACTHGYVWHSIIDEYVNQIRGILPTRYYNKMIYSAYHGKHNSHFRQDKLNQIDNLSDLDKNRNQFGARSLLSKLKRKLPEKIWPLHWHKDSFGASEGDQKSVDLGVDNLASHV